jgi:hypothetical protein
VRIGLCTGAARAGRALGLKAGLLFGTLRVAATAPTVAPPLFETLAGAYRGGQGCAAMIAILG